MTTRQNRARVPPILAITYLFRFRAAEIKIELIIYIHVLTYWFDKFPVNPLPPSIDEYVFWHKLANRIACILELWLIVAIWVWSPMNILSINTTGTILRMDREVICTVMKWNWNQTIVKWWLMYKWQDQQKVDSLNLTSRYIDIYIYIYYIYPYL